MTSTAIESKLIREGGTIIPMEGQTYHFTPYTDGAHVCEVEKTEHIDRFLAIPEGYRLYRGVGLPLGPLSAPAFKAAVAHAQAQEEVPDLAPVAPAPAAAPEILLGGDYPAIFTIHGVDYQLGTVVAQAFAKAGMNVAGWNGMAQDARDAAIEAELNAIDEAGPAPAPEVAAFVPPAAPADPVADEAAERAALVAEYTTLVGKKPHYNVSIGKLRHLLEAERENAAKHAAEATQQQ